jgi:hypothetical protein
MYLNQNSPTVNQSVMAGSIVDKIQAIKRCDEEMLKIRNARKELRKKFQELEALKENLIMSLPEHARPKRGRPLQCD